MSLTPQQLKHFKEKLLARKKELWEQLSTIAVKDPHIKDNWTAVLPEYGIQRADSSEYADEVEEYETRISQEGTMELRLKDIEEALEKIKRGGYGICKKGGEEIEKERLEAMPEAKTCITHSTES